MPATRVKIPKEAWTWKPQRENGVKPRTAKSMTFVSQGDAESWLGEISSARWKLKQEDDSTEDIYGEWIECGVVFAVLVKDGVPQYKLDLRFETGGAGEEIEFYESSA
jgi:hypothetical protein